MRKYLNLIAAITAGAVFAGRYWRRHGKDQRIHVSETEDAYRQARLRILILGSGFGGLSTALRLDRELGQQDMCSVLVVDRDNDMLFTPLLWLVANGRISPNNVVVPIRDFQRGRRFHVLHAEIERIDLQRKEVHTSAGIRPYDRLVIALGSSTSVPDLPGLRAHAIPFYTPSDALLLRNRLVDAVEAAHRTMDPFERQSWLTFAVGGAGDTGVELAAIIHDYLHAGLFREYPWLVDASVRIVVVGRSERVLPTSKPQTSNLVHFVLEQEGITVLTGRSITAASEKAVETTHETIPARTLFWAAGITAPEVVRQLAVPQARNGAIKVDNFLRIPGFSEVYVIGDSSWAYDSTTGAPIPATAQAASHQGDYVGKAITLEESGKPVPAFRYATLGHLALLGYYKGVAELGPWTFDGVAAFLLWHLAYLVRNPSWVKRIRLVIDWALSAILGRDIGQLRTEAEFYERAKIATREARVGKRSLDRGG